MPVKELDILIVEEMGKNISGAGMDTNVIGRVRIPDIYEWPEPRIKVLIVLDLTEESHGNAAGIGLADLTVKRLVEKIDYEATYTNVITSNSPMGGFIPVICKTDREAIRIALDYLIGNVLPHQAKVARIRNTLTLDRLQVSD